jgi:tetratricopeptide (TPR) repeat protein
MKFLIVLAMTGLVAAGCSSVPPTVKAAQDAFKHVKMADKAATKGDIDTAIEHYEMALDLAPGQARKWRFAYAQLLYLKGLSFDVASHSALHKTFGNLFDKETGRWTRLENELSKKEKEEEIGKFKDYKYKALVYFHKAIQQLKRCDMEFNFAVEDVADAMAIVYVMMEEWDNAKRQIRRLLTSSRVPDGYKANLRKVIKLIEKHQREAERSRETEGPEEFTP